MRSSLSRRTLLQNVTLAAGGAALATTRSAFAAPLPATTPSPIQLGMASYTFRQFTRAQVIANLKQLNVADLNAKNVKDHLPTDPDLEAAAVNDYVAAGIRLHAVGNTNFPNNDDADIRAKFEYAKRAGVHVIVAGDPTPATLPRVERFVREYDIRLAIHNHGPEDPIWASPLDILKAIDHLDPRIGCCIDVGHTVRAGTDVVDAIRKVGPRLFNVHMKDLTSFSDKASQVAVGDGKMPVRAIFEALMASGYKDFVDLEYEIHPDDPMPGVTKSLAYMRGVLAGMGYTA